jgi:hypothetical protein
VYHFKTERRAIHSTGLAFSNFGWVFREQPIVDFGIDAFIETTTDQHPDGIFAALQIKGGNNLRRTKTGISIYFSNRHNDYWNAISKKIPVLFIIHDSATDILYWEHFTEFTTSETSKQWKINIPYTNVLNETAKGHIEKIMLGYNEFDIVYDNDVFIEDLITTPEKNVLDEEITIKYFLNKENLLNCILRSNHNQIVTINFQYEPKKENWNKEQEKLEYPDPFYFTIWDFENWVKRKYHLLCEYEKSNPLSAIDVEIKSILSGNRIESLSAFLFDEKNQKHNVPPYNMFTKAFEFHFNLKEKLYSVMTLDESMIFQYEGRAYRIQTYEGLQNRLREFINRKSYEEIYTETNENIWSEIYLDAGIEKDKFIPLLKKEWELYWKTKYEQLVYDNSNTTYLDEQKRQSKNLLITFSNLYDNSIDIIRLAYEIDEFDLYPMVVITMLNIFNAEVCYEEYCEHELFGYDWESISVDDENENSPVFFIQEDDL